MCVRLSHGGQVGGEHSASAGRRPSGSRCDRRLMAAGCPTRSRARRPVHLRTCRSIANIVPNAPNGRFRGVGSTGECSVWKCSSGRSGRVARVGCPAGFRAKQPLQRRLCQNIRGSSWSAADSAQPPLTFVGMRISGQRLTLNVPAGVPAVARYERKVKPGRGLPPAPWLRQAASLLASATSMLSPV